MFSRADAYERFMGRWSRLLAPALVTFSEVQDGDAVLDVGCGTGALSRAVLDTTRAARVTGVDPSADYVALAEQKIGDPRVRFEVGDAQQLGLRDATFDKTLSMLVLNFVPDHARAVKQMIRVTRLGGLVVAAVWDYGDGMEMLRVFWDEATRMDPAIAPRVEAHMPLCKKGELGALWTREGLTNVHEEPLTVTLHFESFDDYWAPFELGQGPAGAHVAALPRDHRTELARRLRSRLLGGGSDRPFDMQARAWAVKGTIGREARAATVC